MIDWAKYFNGAVFGKSLWLKNTELTSAEYNSLIYSDGYSNAIVIL